MPPWPLARIYGYEFSAVHLCDADGPLGTACAAGHLVAAPADTAAPAGGGVSAARDPCQGNPPRRDAEQEPVVADAAPPAAGSNCHSRAGRPRIQSAGT